MDKIEVKYHNNVQPVENFNLNVTYIKKCVKNKEIYKYLIYGAFSSFFL